MRFIAVLALALVPLTASAATCITEKAGFAGYKDRFATDARAAGVKNAGLSALAGAQLSGITWRFESRPSTQTGTLQGDPAVFLAKRSGSTAENFVALAGTLSFVPPFSHYCPVSVKIAAALAGVCVLISPKLT